MIETSSQPPPKDEAEVHARIEGILKCHFSDLKTKPSITKPIKNFVPDSGIPSIRTLIEYKYVQTKEQARILVDQVLADTRGYHSTAWGSLVFVIYETHRVYSEDDWKRHLRECDLDDSFSVVVLQGEEATPLVVAPKRTNQKSN